MATEAAKTFYLVIKTPEKNFCSEPAEEIILETPSGQIGILPGHEPMVSAVAIGPIRIKKEGEWEEAVLSEGFLEVNQDMVVILVDTAEWPDEIDENRARRAEARAQERLQGKLSRIEYAESRAALQRAISRLKVSSHSHKI